MLRHLGGIERLCAVRHSQGSYRCVAVTASYSTSSPDCSIPRLIESALAEIIRRHPILCVGIVGEETNKPAFVRLDSINIPSCIEYQNVIASSCSEYNTALEKILERQHGKQWPEMHRQPPWKIIIVQCETRTLLNPMLDIIFAYHHSLADGISGLLFHDSLLQAFNTASKIETSNQNMNIPEELTLPLPIEQQYIFKISISVLFRALWADTTPKWMHVPGKASFWTANPCTLDHLHHYSSRCKIVSVDALPLDAVIAACRRQNTTLTGLLHGIIVASIATHVPTAKRFKAGTAYSLRHLLKEPASNDMGAYAFGYTLPYSARTISRIRAAENNAKLTQQIWDIARAFSASTKTELKQLQKGHFIALLPHAGDLHKALWAGIGRPRPETFEISNLGRFKQERQASRWKIDRMLLSQSGGAGPAVSFNLVSVDGGGPLTVCATWLQGGIEETLVNLICEDIVRALEGLGAG